MSSSKTEESPDSAALPEDLVAVCLDTNAMSKGRPNLRAIKDLLDIIESQELVTQVWIPEPVLWEWAEHLASELSIARASYQDAMAWAADAGVSNLLGGSWVEPVDIELVVAELATALESIDSVTLLRLTTAPRAATEGLRDQVLLQGVGRRKGNVKTGAADSTLFRLAEGELHRHGGSMLVVSGDQDARRYFSAKPNIIVVDSLSRAKAGILGMRMGSEIAVERVRESIKLRLPHLTRQKLGYPEIVGAESLHMGSRLRGRIIETSVELASVDAVINVAEVDVSHSEGYAAALIEARVSVERELQVLSDINGLVEMDVETFEGRHATVEVSAEKNDGTDWDIVVDKVHLG